MSDIPVDSYDPGVRPGAFAERWQRTVWTAQFAAWFSRRVGPVVESAGTRHWNPWWRGRVAGGGASHARV